ncbi:MAG: hypothetical protein Q8R30_00135 [bacterium]|nr:hypothetical protein [bacterium]MDZ4285391.1 hypothetical protein [Candidatus Sungbacteria bacterium]
MPYFERRGFKVEQKEGFDMGKAYKRASEALDADRIDPETLEGCDKEMVARDMQYVRDREAQFKMESRLGSEEEQKAATVFEAIIHEQVELNDWLGPNAETMSASRFDDIANGVDTIVRFQREGESDSHLGLAIDVTFSTDIRGKLNRIMEDIERGKLTEVKYFGSPSPEDPDEYVYNGGLKVPRVVIGIEKHTVEKLAELWLNKNKKELGAHVVQRVIAKEILDQLELFEKYARSRNNRNNIAETYAHVRDVLERSLNEREDGGFETENTGALKNDRVLGVIEKYLNDVAAAMKVRYAA